MCKSSISLEVKLGEPIYIEENIVMISINLRQKGSEKYSKIDKFVKFNGQVWQTVDDENEKHICIQKLLEHEKQKLYKYYDSQIMILKEETDNDKYAEFDKAIKQVNKELESNKCIDNFEEIQKIKDEKQNKLDYYDKRIAELEEELRRLNKPVIYNNTEFELSDLGIEALELLDDLQADIEDSNNITGDLNCLIASLIKWKKEMDTKLVSQLRDELVTD